MKKLIIIGSVIGMLAACDKVKNPNENPATNGSSTTPVITTCTLTTPIVMTNSSTSNYRKILLEDYTGHTCGNCPRAARKAENLMATYQTSLVVIANHVSTQYASPTPAPGDTIYREDFRDAVNTAWDAKIPLGGLDMSGNGLPKGCVNRTPDMSGNYAQTDGAWASLIPPALNQPQQAQLDITTYYDPVQRLLNVDVKTTFKTAYPNTVKLLVVLTEDSIVGDQKDYFPPAGCVLDADGETRPDYVFDNLFVGSLNGTWGQTVKTGPIAANDTITISNKCALVNKCFYKSIVCVNDKHVHVVAFVYDVTNKQVLQVEKLKIR